MNLESRIMNKRIFWGIGIFSVAVLMGACSDNYENLGNGEEEIPGIEPREVVFSLKNFEADDRSRTNLEVNESGVTFNGLRMIRSVFSRHRVIRFRLQWMKEQVRQMQYSLAEAGN